MKERETKETDGDVDGNLVIIIDPFLYILYGDKETLL